MKTKEAAEILGLTDRRVAELCREGKLYGVKGEGAFGQWDISPNSLRMYVRYNPEFKNRLNGRMSPMVTTKDEVYTVESLAMIFQTDVKSLKKKIRNGEFVGIRRNSFIRKKTEIPAISVIAYLHMHEDERTKLQAFHEKLMHDGSALEGIVRHLLMLYAYYKSNGYLV